MTLTCPGPNCAMCTGDHCNVCSREPRSKETGSGWVCTHDTIERHRALPAVEEGTPTPRQGRLFVVDLDDPDTIARFLEALAVRVRAGLG